MRILEPWILDQIHGWSDPYPMTSPSWSPCLPYVSHGTLVAFAPAKSTILRPDRDHDHDLDLDLGDLGDLGYLGSRRGRKMG